MKIEMTKYQMTIKRFEQNHFVFCSLAFLVRTPNPPVVGTRSEKKWDYVGKIPKWRPPPLPSPLLSKKKLGLFFILEPQEHFWSSPKNHNFWVVNVDGVRHQEVGLGQTSPPPV